MPGKTSGGCGIKKNEKVNINYVPFEHFAFYFMHLSSIGQNFLQVLFSLVDWQDFQEKRLLSFTKQ